jgi:hypothetical protein
MAAKGPLDNLSGLGLGGLEVRDAQNYQNMMAQLQQSSHHFPGLDMPPIPKQRRTLRVITRDGLHAARVYITEGN